MPQAELNSPRISSLSWGHIEVEGYPPFKDVKIFPGGAREWDWRETRTRHVPGIQPADVQELIEHGARAVVLLKGIWKRLQVCPETPEVLATGGNRRLGLRFAADATDEGRGTILRWHCFSQNVTLRLWFTSAAHDASGKQTKQQTCLDLLGRREGATIEDLEEATGWQKHSVRGFLAGAVRKKLGLTLVSERPDAGPRRYRIPNLA